jgi:hypothetical protein
MRHLPYRPSYCRNLEALAPYPSCVKALTFIPTTTTPGIFSAAKALWWVTGPVGASDISVAWVSQKIHTSSEALKNTKLTLSLARKGRQATAELALTLINYEDEVSYPITLFTGSWVACLLGYSRKYRSAKLVETFMGSAIHSYLALYHLTPLCLKVRGPFFNFNFFWKTINSPSNQVFIHPIAKVLIWDIRLPISTNSSFEEIREAMAGAVGEFGRGGVPSLDDEILDYEAKAIAAADLINRYRFSWDQVLFLPTRISRPRRAKKARSIRKRLAKRLVRASGRRFWVG